MAETASGNQPGCLLQQLFLPQLSCPVKTSQVHSQGCKRFPTRLLQALQRAEHLRARSPATTPLLLPSTLSAPLRKGIVQPPSPKKSHSMSPCPSLSHSLLLPSLATMQSPRDKPAPSQLRGAQCPGRLGAPAACCP